jgi:Ca2+-binding RTX toxin-like protein
VTPSGALTYSPAPDVSGSATITLVLQDNGGTANGGVNASTPRTFTITVTPVNDPPDATDSSFNTIVNVPVSGTVSASDSDGPGLTYALQALPALGTVTSFNTSTGAFAYTPNASVTGLDLFTFSVTDGTSTDTATVRIVIGSNVPVVTSTGGNVEVIGTAAEDTVIISRGPAGQVLIRTQNGSGYYPLTGTITINAGDARDYLVINGLANPATIDAGGGNDYVSSGTGDDVIIGGSGDDKINASSGNNVVWGDELGQQDLAAGGNDILSSLGGSDIIYGGGGADQIYPGDGVDYAYAGQGDDLISAGGGNDRVYGGAGNDVLAGDAGDDVLSGGSGNDLVLGSDGNDVLIGGAGGAADALDGGAGNDLLIGSDTTNSASSTPGDTNDVALMALLAAWSSTHAAGLANGIVQGDDGVADSLTGYTGDDDFYANLNDSLNDLNAANMGTDRKFP